MRIQPIDNTQPKTNFKAKFPKQDVKLFLSEIDKHDICMEPQLYTLLDLIKKLPEKKAKIDTTGGWYQILLDGKSLTNGHKYINAFYALYDSIVINKRSVSYNNGLQRLSEDTFESMYYKNSKKTKQDIEKTFLK